MKSKVSKKEVFYFIAIMLIFLVGTVVMLFYKVENLWVWIGYVSVWTWLEASVAKNIRLKWWVWALIILGICCLDLIIIGWLS